MKVEPKSEPESESETKMSISEVKFKIEPGDLKQEQVCKYEVKEEKKVKEEVEPEEMTIASGPVKGFERIPQWVADLPLPRDKWTLQWIEKSPLVMDLEDGEILDDDEENDVGNAPRQGPSRDQNNSGFGNKNKVSYGRGRYESSPSRTFEPRSRGSNFRGSRRGDGAETVWRNPLSPETRRRQSPRGYGRNNYNPDGRGNFHSRFDNQQSRPYNGGQASNPKRISARSRARLGSPPSKYRRECSPITPSEAATFISLKRAIPPKDDPAILAEPISSDGCDMSDSDSIVSIPVVRKIPEVIQLDSESEHEEVDDANFEELNLRREALEGMVRQLEDGSTSAMNLETPEDDQSSDSDETHMSVSPSVPVYQFTQPDRLPAMNTSASQNINTQPHSDRFPCFDGKYERRTFSPINNNNSDLLDNSKRIIINYNHKDRPDSNPPAASVFLDESIFQDSIVGARDIDERMGQPAASLTNPAFLTHEHSPSFPSMIGPQFDMQGARQVNERPLESRFDRNSYPVIDMPFPASGQIWNPQRHVSPILENPWNGHGDVSPAPNPWSPAPQNQWGDHISPVPQNQWGPPISPAPQNQWGLRISPVSQNQWSGPISPVPQNQWSGPVSPAAPQMWNSLPPMVQSAWENTQSLVWRNPIQGNIMQPNIIQGQFLRNQPMPGPLVQLSHSSVNIPNLTNNPEWLLRSQNSPNMVPMQNPAWMSSTTSFSTGHVSTHMGLSTENLSSVANHTYVPPMRTSESQFPAVMDIVQLSSGSKPKSQPQFSRWNVQESVLDPMDPEPGNTEPEPLTWTLRDESASPKKVSNTMTTSAREGRSIVSSTIQSSSVRSSNAVDKSRTIETSRKGTPIKPIATSSHVHVDDEEKQLREQLLRDLGKSRKRTRTTEASPVKPTPKPPSTNATSLSSIKRAVRVTNESIPISSMSSANRPSRNLSWTRELGSQNTSLHWAQDKRTVSRKKNANTHSPLENFQITVANRRVQPIIIRNHTSSSSDEELLIPPSNPNCPKNIPGRISVLPWTHEQIRAAQRAREANANATAVPNAIPNVNVIANPNPTPNAGTNGSANVISGIDQTVLKAQLTEMLRASRESGFIKEHLDNDLKKREAAAEAEKIRQLAQTKSKAPSATTNESNKVLGPDGKVQNSNVRVRKQQRKIAPTGEIQGVNCQSAANASTLPTAQDQTGKNASIAQGEPNVASNVIESPKKGTKKDEPTPNDAKKNEPISVVLKAEPTEVDKSKNNGTPIQKSTTNENVTTNTMSKEPRSSTIVLNNNNAVSTDSTNGNICASAEVSEGGNVITSNQVVASTSSDADSCTSVEILNVSTSNQSSVASSDIANVANQPQSLTKSVPVTSTIPSSIKVTSAAAGPVASSSSNKATPSPAVSKSSTNERKELLLRHKLVEAQLARTIELSKVENSLRSLRASTVKAATVLKVKSKRISGTKQVYRQLLAQASTLREQLLKTEQRMGVLKLSVKGMVTEYTDECVKLQANREICTQLETTCKEMGAKIHGPEYRAPFAYSTEMIVKLAEIQKQADALKVDSIVGDEHRDPPRRKGPQRGNSKNASPNVASNAKPGQKSSSSATTTTQAATSTFKDKIVGLTKHGGTITVERVENDADFLLPPKIYHDVVVNKRPVVSINGKGDPYLENYHVYDSPLLTESEPTEEPVSEPIDPEGILCKFELNGLCTSQSCPFQHLLK